MVLGGFAGFCKVFFLRRRDEGLLVERCGIVDDLLQEHVSYKKFETPGKSRKVANAGSMSDQ